MIYLLLALLVGAVVVGALWGRSGNSRRGGSGGSSGGDFWLFIDFGGGDSDCGGDGGSCD